MEFRYSLWEIHFIFFMHWVKAFSCNSIWWVCLDFLTLWVCLDCVDILPFLFFGIDLEIGGCLDCSQILDPRKKIGQHTQFFCPRQAKSCAKLLARPCFGRARMGAIQTATICFPGAWNIMPCTLFMYIFEIYVSCKCLELAKVDSICSGLVWWFIRSRSMRLCRTWRKNMCWFFHSNLIRV
jgi:hypothetical protein